MIETVKGTVKVENNKTGQKGVLRRVVDKKGIKMYYVEYPETKTCSLHLEEEYNALFSNVI